MDPTSTIRTWICWSTCCWYAGFPPWHNNAGKRLVKSPKVYVRDSGLVHALLNIGDSEALLAHPVAGVTIDKRP